MVFNLRAHILKEVERTKTIPGGVARHRSGQCWYSAAAAKNISEETHDEGDDLEDEREAALGLERRLHAPPAIQFVSESRRGGFNKVMFVRHWCWVWITRRAEVAC